MSRRRLALIAAIALAARVGYVAAFMRGYRPTSDADSYYAIGRAVSQGHGYAFTLPFEFVHATAIRPPLYPTVLAGAFRVFGVHVGVAQGVNVVAGCAAVVLGAVMADRIGGPRAGLCAGIVLALYPSLLANDVTVLVESIAVLLLFATVLFLADGRTVLAGISLGLLMLDRASAQWFVLVIAAWVVWRFGWRHAVRLVVVALVVVSPWVARNAVDVGGPVLVATNGFNLNALYSNEARQSGDGFVDAYFDPRFADLSDQSADEVDLDAKLRQKALRDLRGHPTEVFRVVRINLERWFELRPGMNKHPEQVDGRNLHVRDWTLPLFYAVTVAGIFALVRARRAATAQLLVLAASYFTAVCLFSVAVPRLRSMFDGCLAVGAGIAIAWIIDRRPQIEDRPPPLRPLRAARSAQILGAIAVLIAATAFAWQAETHRQAHRAITAAVARDASSLDALVSQYRADRPGRPPRLSTRDLDRARDLLTVLGQRAPQAASPLRSRVADALRAVRVASHEADIVGLLSAGEYLDAAAHHRPASLAAVRARYDNQVRPGDPTLEPWAAVVSGSSLLRARAALAALR